MNVNYAPSLFDNFAMRKTAKSALAQSLELDKHTISEYGSTSATIIDGGHLLHVVVWSPPLTHKTVIDLYVNDVISHCNQGRIIVIVNRFIGSAHQVDELCRFQDLSTMCGGHFEFWLPPPPIGFMGTFFVGYLLGL